MSALISSIVVERAADYESDRGGYSPELEGQSAGHLLKWAHVLASETGDSHSVRRLIALGRELGRARRARAKAFSEGGV